MDEFATQSPAVGGPTAPVGSAQGTVSVNDELGALLPLSSGQLGDVARLMSEGVTERNDLVAAGAAANYGAVANIQSSIRAIRYGEIPDAPSRARLAKSAASSFLKQHRDVLSHGAMAHLEQVIASSAAIAANTSAQDVEETELHKKGDELENTLVMEGGVYVFTFPHYWWYPTVEGTDRTLLKVGMTTKDAGVRVKTQARQAGLPEDPLLLRVYQSPTLEPAALERVFHRLLRAADHVREPSSSGGKEWFETSIEFLDTVAEVVGASVLVAEEPE